MKKRNVQNLMVKEQLVTADGREIKFGLNVEMSRSFTEYNQLSYVETYPQILTDPLVINLDSNPTTVSDQTFSLI